MINKRFNSKEFKKTRLIPFWSWNDKLDEKRLCDQIDWMKDKKMSGFFMHARSGLKTEYLSDEWFDCIRACVKKGAEVGLEPWAYDENGWPSGFVGGELLKDKNNLENFLEYSIGDSDDKALVCYDLSGESLVRIDATKVKSANCLNVFKRTAVSSVDVLDKEVVDKFINLTHERYKKELGKDFDKLKGFFTDEPQFCRRATLYPHIIEKYYLENFNENILDNLGLLFVEKKGYKAFRYKYWKTCQKLFLENFAKNIFDWCDKNGKELTGHYIEERDLFAQMLYNAGIMPFYEYEHIPGIDWLCKRFMTIVPIRQLVSVACQLDKKDVLTECYAMTGWDVTPKELKAITEFQYMYGINTVCQHLLPYSERQERKNDYPTHTCDLNPWMKEGLSVYNDYIAKLGGIIKGSEEFVNVAILQPIRSAYFNFKVGDYSSTRELDESFLNFSNAIAKKGIGFHYLDETLLEKHGFVKGDRICCGRKEYKYLILPKMYTMDIYTEKLLREFCNNGGKVFIAFDKPSYLEGEKYDYSYLQSNVSLDDIIKDQPYSIQTFSDNLFSSYRKCKDYDYIFLLNIDDDKNAECKLFSNGYLSEYNISTGEEFAVDGRVSVKPLQSKIIIVDKKLRKYNNPINNNLVLFPCNNLEVVNSSDNCLVLDYAKLSKDGKNYSDKKWVACIFDELLHERYEGDIFLKFNFVLREKIPFAYLAQEFNQAEIFINGNKIDFNGNLKENIDMKTGVVTDNLIVGNNEVTVKIRFYENPNVYYALYGEGVTESLRNCLVYDTYIDCMYLYGNFGVYSDIKMEQTRERDVLICDNFYIANKKNIISEQVKDGFPFFSGCLRLKKNIILDNKNVSLLFTGRIHYAKVYCNGNFVQDIMFDNIVDISKFAKLGENIVEIELFNSARNTFGPFHDARFAELGSVTPFFFGLPNTWHNGKSLIERKEYAITRQGIFKNSPKDWYHI